MRRRRVYRQRAGGGTVKTLIPQITLEAIREAGDE